MKTIKIFGDKYKIRKTYDIDDIGIGIYGFEIYDKDNKFLKYVGGLESINSLKAHIKQYFYKVYK